jgi:hypothetical protein
MKGTTMEPKLEKGVKVDFQVGRQINGKPCATYIYLSGGKLVHADEATLVPQKLGNIMGARMGARTGIQVGGNNDLLGKRRANFDDYPPPKRISSYNATGSLERRITAPFKTERFTNTTLSTPRIDTSYRRQRTLEPERGTDRRRYVNERTTQFRDSYQPRKRY